MQSKKSESTIELLKKLIFHIGKKKLTTVILLQLLSILSSFVEALSVGAIIPFITLIGNPEKAINVLSWRPIWSQEEAIKRTFKWWKNLIEGHHNPIDLCIGDVIEYMVKVNE
jgi:hypothetical protein